MIAKTQAALERQEAKLARQGDLETTIARQQEQIETLTAGVQKVSERLQASRPAPQVAANDQ